MKTIRNIIAALTVLALPIALDASAYNDVGACFDFTQKSITDQSWNGSFIENIKEEDVNPNLGLQLSSIKTYVGRLGNILNSFDVNNTNGWTISYWIKLDSFDECKSSLFSLNGSFAEKLEIGKWYHVVQCYDPNRTRAWQNGTHLEDKVVVCINYEKPGSALSEMTLPDIQYLPKLIMPVKVDGTNIVIRNEIGYKANPFSIDMKKFNGYIANLIVVNRCLSQYEMAILYHSNAVAIFSTGQATHVNAFEQDGDYTNLQSAWSSFGKPHAGSTYVVCSGHNLRFSNAARISFNGEKLILGENNPMISRINHEVFIPASEGHLSIHNVGSVELGNVVLNNGSISIFGKCDINGTFYVTSKIDKPFTINSCGNVTISGFIFGEKDSVIKIVNTSKTKAKIDANLSGFRGQIIVD